MSEAIMLGIFMYCSIHFVKHYEISYFDTEKDQLSFKRLTKATTNNREET